MSTSGVSIGIAVSSAGRGGTSGNGGGGAGACTGDGCRLAGFVSTLNDFERVISVGYGSMRSRSKSSTRRNNDRSEQTVQIDTYVKNKLMS